MTIKKIPHKWWHWFFTSVVSWRSEIIHCYPEIETSSVIYYCSKCDCEYEIDTTKKRIKI